MGVPVQERLELFQTCENMGLTVDVAAYQAGHRKGLVEYCTLENGFDVGFSGRSYQDVCPAENEADFLQGYEIGLAEYEDSRPAAVIYPSIGIGWGFRYGYFGSYGFGPPYW
ncbi:DUF2799 domain-containing protein [Rhodobacteraceae bacterium NNCM2]|nr:DUF2799 domain-containing protein [Coraliihabitans acroporae]